MSRWIRSLVAPSLALALCCVSAGADEVAATPSGFEQKLDVDRVLMPMTLEGAGCAGLTIEDLRISEDRKAVPRVTAIETRRRSAIHALLIDTSESMKRNDAISRAIEAAQSYLESLPPGEQLMLVTFADDVRLRVPLTSLSTPGVRERLSRELEALTAGGGTAMRDAVYTTLRYLETFPQRKALVLLTDGIDSSSPQLEGAFVDQATDVGRHDVAIFPVGLNIRTSSSYGKLLETLARKTGGVFFPLVDHGSEATNGSVVQAFGRIRELLLRQVTIEYVAESWQGAQRGGRSVPERRRVRAKIDRDDCSALHYRQVRWVNPPRDKPEAQASRPWPPAAPTRHERTEIDSLAGWRLLYGASVPRDSPSLYVQANEEGIEGRSLDFSENAGMFYVKTGGFHAMRAASFPRFETRPFRLDPPEFEDVIQQRVTVEDQILLLGLDALSSGDPLDNLGIEKSFVAGPTLPWLRGPVAKSIFDRYPRYREWTARKLELEVRADVERFIIERLFELGGEGFAKLDLETRRAGLIQSLRLGTEWDSWKGDLLSTVEKGSTAIVRSLITKEWLGQFSTKTPSEDVVRYAVESVLSTRLQQALAATSTDEALERELSQLDRVRGVLVERRLAEVGENDYARFVADWLADWTPYQLAMKVQTAAANSWLEPEGSSRASLMAFDSTWRRLAQLLSSSGLRTRALLVLDYDAQRDRIGFHRISPPAPEFRVSRLGPFRAPVVSSVELAETFPEKPWALEALRGLVDVESRPERVTAMNQRTMRRGELIDDLLSGLDDEIDQLESWDLQAPGLLTGKEKRESLRQQRDTRRQRRGELILLRDRLANAMRKQLPARVVEVRMEFAKANDPALHLVAYAKASRSDDESLPFEPVCVQSNLPSLQHREDPCEFVDELTKWGSEPKDLDN